VVGTVYGRFLLGMVQVAFFLLLGKLVFKVNLGTNLWAILLILSIYSWMAASLGVWIGSVVKQEDKIVGLCVLASIMMAALGGCWWPLEIVPETMQLAARCVPSGWAMDALHQLISFGAGIDTILPHFAVLGLFAIVANVGASVTFRV
jgi:ABC-2 type transport system permease protein